MSYTTLNCPNCGSTKISDVAQNKFIVFCDTCKKFTSRKALKKTEHRVVSYSEKCKMIEEKYGTKDDI